MKINIEVDHELADTIVKKDIEWHIGAVKEEIKKFKKIKKPINYQIEDYNYNQKLLFALKIVGEYYGVKKL
jgi:hypothetical protein